MSRQRSMSTFEPLRYIALLRQLLKTSLQVAMQYRLDFFLSGGMAIFWLVWNVAPVALVFHHRPEVGGWTLPEALLVIAFFLVLKAALEGAVSPNLLTVVEHIRRGTLDFVLIKPKDAQFMLSASRFAFAKVVDVVGAVALGIWASARLHLVPSVGQLLACSAMLASSTAILYSLWLLVISLAFWFVRVDNLSHLFGAIFDAGRWPVSVFRGWVRFALTFVVPVGLMTTYPAMALLGTLETSSVIAALLLATGFLLVSRRVWKSALRRYSSASS
jgi:ABC-2 type transport system permease protein